MKYAGITVRNGQVKHKQGSGPVAGAVARVESVGQIDRRITVTRMALTGPFAFALRKKKDKRELFLTVEGDGYSIMVDVGPKDQAAARKFAAELNSMARRQAPTSPAGRTAPPVAAPALPVAPLPVAAPAPPTFQPPAAPPPPVDVLGQLTQLGALRDSGVLNGEEFAAQKAAILGTPPPSEPEPELEPEPEPAPVSYDHLPPPPSAAP